VLMYRCRFQPEQMTFGRKTGMKGVAEETGVTPAKI
jgi:hypothetical protein